MIVRARARVQAWRWWACVDDNTHASPPHSQAPPPQPHHHAVSDASVNQLHREAAERGAFHLFLFGEGGGLRGVRDDGGVGGPPISLITSSDWLFGRSAAVNTPVSSSVPHPPGGGGGGAPSALHNPELRRRHRHTRAHAHARQYKRTKCTYCQRVRIQAAPQTLAAVRDDLIARSNKRWALSRARIKLSNFSNSVTFKEGGGGGLLGIGDGDGGAP